MSPEPSKRSDILKRIIHIDDHFSPNELMTLWQAIEQEHPLVKQHLQQTVSAVTALSTVIKHYERTVLAEHVMLYTSPPQPSHPRKSLLLCFSGHGGRMTMTTPMFLQCVPQAQFDVVMLRDPAKLYYLTGVAGYGSSLTDVLKHLVRDIDFDSYADVRCLSTSAGGTAAIVAGMALGAKRTIAIAPMHPTDEIKKVAERGRPDLTGMELANLPVLRTAQAPVDSMVVFGGKNALDKERALRMKAHMPGIRLATMGDIEDHMLLRFLVLRNQLPKFFEAYLCPDHLS
jgi:hypothetical protein